MFNSYYELDVESDYGYDAPRSKEPFEEAIYGNMPIDYGYIDVMPGELYDR